MTEDLSVERARVNADRLVLSLESVPALLEEGRVSLSGFLESHEVGPKALYAAELVFEEIVTNILRYAFDGAGQRTLEIEVAIGTDEIAMTFEDNGTPFDPCAAAQPVRPGSLAEAKPGGLGIHLVRKMSKSMRYERSQGRNRLEVRIARH